MVVTKGILAENHLVHMLRFVFAARKLVQFDSNMDSSGGRWNQGTPHLQCQRGPQAPICDAGESRGIQKEKGQHDDSYFCHHQSFPN